MKDIIEPVDTDDGLFHDGDPSTGAEGTIVCAKIMNALQGGLISTQSEIKTILAEAGFKPDASSVNQLLAALKKIFITENSGIVKNALQKDNNLSDVVDKTKALANIKGVPDSRKINGHSLTGDTNITAQDIFNGQAVGIGTNADLNAYITPGLYYQPANAQAQTGKNYPEANAGSLEVYKHAGITQIYRIYNSSRAYIRTLYGGTWSSWTKQYDAANKPSAVDVGAIPVAGSTAVTGVVRNSAEFQQTSANGYRMVYGNYGVFWRQDGANLYLMLTNSGDQYGGYNSLRPFAVSLPSGDITMGKLNLTNFQYFDARYYTKAQSDAGYMPRTSAYTKTESDGRFQPKGSYTPTGTAYTKAESNSRFVQNIQLGARALNASSNESNPKGNAYLPNGCVAVGYTCSNSDANNMKFYYKPIQKNINGTWTTIGG